MHEIQPKLITYPKNFCSANVYLRTYVLHYKAVCMPNFIKEICTELGN